MGGNQSGEFSSNYLKEFSNHYVFLKEQNDPRFGLIKVYKRHESDEEVMIVKRMYTTEEEYEYFQRELNLRLSFQHKNLLHLLGYQKESNSNLCGHSRVYELFSEYHSHNLKKEIQKRTTSSDFFTAAELWYLAESCLSVGCFLQDRNIYHGDFRPINIMLSDDGYVKIPDNGILTSIRNNYFKTLSGECRGYLASELLRAFSRRDPSPKYNVYKADVFSLGITFLYASTLVRPNTVCYDWSQYALNSRGISDLLKKVESRYSVAWRELIENMIGLGKDEDARPDFRLLYPLKIGVPQQQPMMIQPYIREEQLPIRKGAELKLINTQVLDDRDYELYESGPGYNENAYFQQQYTSQQPQTFATSQIYSPPPPPPPPPPPSQIYTSQNQVIQGSTYQQQPVPQQYIYQSSYEHEQPKAIPQPLYSQSLINQQQVHVQRPLYNEPMQVMSQPGPIIHQSLYNPQVTSLYGSQYLNQQPAIVQQSTFQPPFLQEQGEIIRQQGEIIRQPVYREQMETGYQQYQIPPNQYQYQEMQPSVVRQNFVGQQGVVDFRREQVKQGGYERGPMVLQSVQEERVERYEDNDLDKRVRDALRATQETIDRNTKMQNEAQKYQNGNV